MFIYFFYLQRSSPLSFLHWLLHRKHSSCRHAWEQRSTRWFCRPVQSRATNTSPASKAEQILSIAIRVAITTHRPSNAQRPDLWTAHDVEPMEMSICPIRLCANATSSVSLDGVPNGFVQTVSCSIGESVLVTGLIWSTVIRPIRIHRVHRVRDRIHRCRFAYRMDKCTMATRQIVPDSFSASMVFCIIAFARAVSTGANGEWRAIRLQTPAVTVRLVFWIL